MDHVSNDVEASRIVPTKVDPNTGGAGGVYLDWPPLGHPQDITGDHGRKSFRRSGGDAVNAYAVRDVGNNVVGDHRIEGVSEHALPHVHKVVVVDIVPGAGRAKILITIEADAVVRNVG